MCLLVVSKSDVFVGACIKGYNSLIFYEKQMTVGSNDILIFLILFHHPQKCIHPEADRDALDWSGKKPLDYQKQLTSVSASTFNSEYKILNNVIFSNIQTLPTRQNTMKKLRNRTRYATTTGSTVQRSFSIVHHDDDAKDSSVDRKSSDDTKSLANEAGSSDMFSTAKRKEKRYRQSFLKKTLSIKRN